MICDGVGRGCIDGPAEFGASSAHSEEFPWLGLGRIRLLHAIPGNAPMSSVQFLSKFGCGRNAGCPAPPRADPYVRHYRIRLLPKVVTHQSVPPDRGGFDDSTAHDDERDGRSVPRTVDGVGYAAAAHVAKRDIPRCGSPRRVAQSMSRTPTTRTICN